MSALIIANTQVHQDRSGYYSLNDLHHAAGGEPRHKPSEWLRIQQAQELLEELGKAGIPALVSRRGGSAPGTYACKELVYSFAMWISPKFHLHVIRAFDAMVMGKAANDPPPASRQLSMVNREFKAALSIAKAVGLKGNQAALSADRAVTQALGVSPLKLIGAPALAADERLLTATELGGECNLTAREMNSLLEAYGYQEKTRDAKKALVWRPTKIGETFGVWLDTGKAYTNGAPVQQLKWKASIVEHLAVRLKSA